MIAQRNKLKILILSHSSELSGGAERSMLDLFEYWTAKDYIEPHFIIRKPNAGLEKELKKRNWAYTSIHYTNWAQRNPTKDTESIFTNTKSNGKAVREIEDLIDKVKPDIVMTNTIIAPWAALAAYYKKIPHVWFVREFGTDHGHVFEIGRENTFHDIGVLSSLVITNSETLADDVRKYVNPKKVIALYNPFKFREINNMAREAISSPFKDNNSLKLIVTGRISESKGQEYIARAVGELIKKGHNVELCVVGSPSQPSDALPLRRTIDMYGIQDKVHLVGHQENPLAFVEISDIGIMSSVKEAFGRVTFEYMALGKPVVGADSGATPELVDDHKTGRLFKVGDSQDLAKKIEFYIKNSKNIKTHGVAARKKAETMMTGSRSADLVYKKMSEAVAGWKNSIREPIFFTERWLSYPSIAQKYIDITGSLSGRRLLYRIVRARVKHVYIKLGGRRFKLKK